MLVIVVFSAVCSVVFSQISQIQQRATAEQTNVGQFEEARDFVDQMFRDTRQVGYPNIRDFSAPTGGWANPSRNDHRLAAGIIKLTTSQLVFEGDVDGSGTVSLVSYTVNGSGTCANCLQRAQISKASESPLDGDPLTALGNIPGTSYSIEVQNVQNTSSLFAAYDSTGASINLPIDIDNNAATVAGVRVIELTLQVTAQGVVDPQTGKQLEADIKGRVQVLNCSMATTGLANTCQ